MAGKVVTLKLNQQQIELLDRTIAKGVAPDRASLVRLALRDTRPSARRRGPRRRDERA
jgi:Arc/MetJ-type ribon-helix-helix transcriptional regulator